MKSTVILAFIAAATLASADSNAQRFARGLPPNAPNKRGTPVANVARSQPSNSPGQCNTGSVQCCDSYGNVGSGGPVDDMVKSFNIDAQPGTNCGVSCSPWNGIGVGNSGSNCNQEPVCCDNNDYQGLIVIGCSPINIYL